MADRGPAPDSNPRKVPETIDGSSGDAIADEPGSPTRGRWQDTDVRSALGDTHGRHAFCLSMRCDATQR
jgi:hypothetical protein